MRFYSIIIPVYNRPKEIEEILQSLEEQTFKNFEILIIEDGSNLKCEDICKKFEKKLTIRYFYKPNSGQGFSRNFGFERAKGDYFIQFDSDAIIPPTYFEEVEKALAIHQWDAFGGPDAAASNFTSIQKAVNYSMTSVFTTGGIRGKKNNMGGQFHPRSFNFGISRKVYEKVGGYIITRMGEDIEFSIRIIENGFKVGLIPEAFIYHKRRTDFKQFFKQLHFFGRARINISRFFPKELKLVHWFPALFTIYLVSIPLLLLLIPILGKIAFGFLVLFLLLLFIDGSIKNKSLKIGLLGVVAGITQLTGYGIGFLSEFSKGSKSNN